MKRDFRRRAVMQKIEAIIKPFKLDEVKEALSAMNREPVRCVVASQAERRAQFAPRLRLTRGPRSW